MNQTITTGIAPILIFGGPSDERLVSVASAQNLLGPNGLDFEPWFISIDLKVHLVTAKEVIAHNRPFEIEFKPSSPGIELDTALDSIEPGRVVFIGLHGTWGEDGQLQERLERRGIFFTGTRSESCRIAFDKTLAKDRVRSSGHLVPESLQPDATLPWPTRVRDLFEKCGPFVMKPVRGGSSIGLHLVRTETDLQQLENALTSGADKPGNLSDYTFEAIVQGREITIGVMDNGQHLRALPVSEIVMVADGNFDYQGKYLGRGSTEITPADLDPKLAKQASELAMAAHWVIACRGYSRTDIILGPEGPVFLEINTHPGLTHASFIPQQLAAAGVPFKTFLETQLATAGTIKGEPVPSMQ